MNLVVHKFRLQLIETQTVDMHAPVKHLSVKIKDGELFLWSLVDADRPKFLRYVRIFGTGHSGIPLEMIRRHEYIGTVIGGDFVWHVWIEPA